ncbi:hypothetical protein N7457_003017 [Penicillium paradoxum]|uniref:uncharacterized protein n=1 Tax=Penicillium paradoxum TaxID=176176 RepID=UPI0025470BAD|nr:uncharacterized protein N7457_003017 [Penicillium paradoxum]KAJ5788027.1 hypothetical protein N7457_003017 [Penicillium paradoxum]
MRQWAENLRDTFNDIRNSPDPALREYYQDLHELRQKHTQETWEKKFGELQEYMAGKNAIVKEGHCGELSEISMGGYRSTISRKLGLKFTDREEVFFQFELADTLHRHAYARKARIDDPAGRFAISVKGSNGSGE